MEYSTQGSKDHYSYSPQAHNLYPHAQPGLYPPPPPEPVQEPPQGGYQQYQGYLGGAAADRARGWSPADEQAAAPLSDDGPFHYHYQDDADCITFLRGCLAGLCCCFLLEQCCCL